MTTQLAYKRDRTGKLNVATAMRFSPTIPGISTMIVGTQKPGRRGENAHSLFQRPLPAEQYEAIRARRKEVAGPDWTS